jgi:hypothetical protein
LTAGQSFSAIADGGVAGEGCRMKDAGGRSAQSFIGRARPTQPSRSLERCRCYAILSDVRGKFQTVAVGSLVRNMMRWSGVGQLKWCLQTEWHNACLRRNALKVCEAKQLQWHDLLSAVVYEKATAGA